MPLEKPTEPDACKLHQETDDMHGIFFNVWNRTFFCFDFSLHVAHAAC